MTDQPGREPEQRLPVPRPPAEPAPAARLSSPPSARRFELTPERAASIVRQSASARFVGFLVTLFVVLFVIVYYFYELGFPAGLTEARLKQEEAAQQVTSVERGYNIYQANCARCHSQNGQGGIGPKLNDQSKLFWHLKPDYIRNILTVGGRFACGNAKSGMPVWANTNGGPLNYIQINELIAFLRAPSDQEYEIRDPELNEPVRDETGKVRTFPGWRDPNWKPAPDATPFPDCWSATGPSGSATPAPSVPPDAVRIQITAEAIKFDITEMSAPADQAFVIEFTNKDQGVPHDVTIKDATGAILFQGEKSDQAETKTYLVPPLTAGTYTFYCSFHPIPQMTGILTIK